MRDKFVFKVIGTRSCLPLFLRTLHFVSVSLIFCALVYDSVVMMSGKLLQSIRGEWMESKYDSILQINPNGDVTIRLAISNSLQVVLYLML